MPRARKAEATGAFVPGQLSYLPQRRDDEPLSLSGSEIPMGCYNHPVLILSTDQRKKKAVVLILTSFGGKSLDEHSSTPRIRAFRLPIHPSPVHPDNGILLFLDQDLKLRKKTYINTETQHSIQWASLQPNYRERKTGKRFRLRPDSFAQLLEYIKPEAPVVRRTNSVTFHTPLHPSRAYPRGWDLVHPTRAENSLAQYGSCLSRPTVPPPRALLETPKYTTRAPTVVPSTLQAVARSREGAAAEVDRYMAQRREARRREARSILPTYSPIPRTDPVGYPNYGTHDLCKLFGVFVWLVVVAGVYLTLAWLRCRRWVCK